MKRIDGQRRSLIAVIGLLTIAFAFAVVVPSITSAFDPGSSPYDAEDADPSCAPAGGLPSPGGSSVTVACLAPEGPGSVTWIPDEVAGNSDDSWVQGTSSDCFLAKSGGGSIPTCVTQGDGSIPGKNDLEQLGVGLAKVGNDFYFYGGINREDAGGISSSNANYNVEINQLDSDYEPDPTVCGDGVTGACNRWRSPKDIVFMVDWGGNTASCGISTPAICIYEWIDTTGPDANSGTCFNASAPPCWGNVQALGVGTANAAGSIAADSRFSEFGVSLTGIGLVGEGECLVFNGVVASSRASSSFTAEEKDRLSGDVDLSTCSSTDTQLHEVNSSGTDVSPSNNGKTISVNAGAYVLDVATVSNGATVNGGYVDFRYYSSSEDCSADTDGSGGTGAGTDKAVSNDTATSDVVQFNTPGTFYWRAFFHDHPTLDDSSSACDEILTVVQLPTSMSTQPWAYPNDKATVSASGGGDLAGNVVFKLFGPASGNTALQNCQADDGTGQLYTETKAVAGSSPQSVETNNTTVRVNADITVYWLATYTSTNPGHGDRVSDCVENIVFTGDTSGGSPPPTPTPTP